MRVKKINQKMTVLTLVVALGAAVYLNWAYAKNAEISLEAEPTGAGVVTDELAVETQAEAGDESDASQTSQTGDKTYGEAQLVSVGSESSTDFFENARLTRSKTRDEALDTLQTSLKKSSLSDEEKEELTQQLTQQIDAITQESDVENLIKAKGFVDCVAFIDNGTVNITVMTSGDGLTADQVAQIRDIVLSKCNVSAQNITVVEVK